MTRTCKALLLLVLLTPLLVNAGDINQELIEAAKKGDTTVVKVLLAPGADVYAKAKTLDLSGDWEGTTKWAGISFTIGFSVARNSREISKLDVIFACSDGTGKVRAKQTKPSTISNAGGFTFLAGQGSKGTGKFTSADTAEGSYEAPLSIKCGDEFLKISGKWTARKSVELGQVGEGAPPPANTEELNADLLAAAKKGDTAAFEALLAKGADVNAEDEASRTALMGAALEGHTAAVQALLDAGADVNAKNKDGGTALLWGTGQGHTATVRALLAAGANVNAKDKHGHTALMVAAENGHTAMVQALLAAGADVNAKEAKDGWTALMYAAVNGDAAAVQALVDAGADVNAKSKMRYTALLYATASGHTAVVQLLKKAGAKE